MKNIVYTSWWCMHEVCNTIFFRFPRDPILKGKWVRALRRPDTWSPSVRSVVCSLHFKDSDYMAYQKGASHLMPKAVSSLNIEVRDFMHLVSS